MRFSRNLRRLGAAAAVTAVAVLGTALPAAADVTVSPNTAVQGGSAEFDFKVTNEHPTAALSKVRLVLPPTLPIAEVYPLSIANWAPLISTRKLNPPLKSLHGEGEITLATTDILWTATAGNALLPGSAVDFQIALGPMPEQVTQMQFAFQPTYDDGSTAPAIPSATVTLTPAAPGQAGAHAGMAPQAAAPDSDEDQVTGDEQGTDWWNMMGWLAAVLCAGFAAVLVVRSRRAAAGQSGATPGVAKIAAAKSRPAKTDWAKPGSAKNASTKPGSTKAGPAKAGPAKAGPAKAGSTGGGAAGAGSAKSKGEAAPSDATSDGDETDDTHKARVSAWSYRDQS